MLYFAPLRQVGAISVGGKYFFEIHYKRERNLYEEDQYIDGCNQSGYNGVEVITVVRLSKRAESDLVRIPVNIAMKLRSWIVAVEKDGLVETRKIPGFHDEALRGGRAGQRSIRLNRAYRAIYIIQDDGALEFVQVIEVNKHEY